MNKKLAYSVIALFWAFNISYGQDSPKEISKTENPAILGSPLSGEPIVLTEEIPANDMVVNTGISVYLVRPSFRSDPVFGVNVPNGPNFDYGLDYAPSAWMELMLREDIGLRTRYFQYTQATQHRQDSSDAKMSGQAKLSLMTWDFEATKHLTIDNWNWKISFGGRYLFLDSRYEGRIRDITQAIKTFVSTDTDSRHHLTGGGPTAAVEFSRPVGTSGCGIYGSARAAIAFGEMSQTVTNVLQARSNGRVETTTTFAQRSDFAAIPTGEFEIGGESTYNLGRYRLSTQLGYVVNVWGGVGNASLKNSTVTPEERQTLLLTGLAIRFGVNY